jgi:putative endonuclease
MSDETKRLGRVGEFAAGLFYEMNDATILERNWTCRFGEVDLIVLDQECLAFVEVKTRKSLNAGFPEESVTKAKQKKYILCAKLYCETHDIEYESIRFDVIAVHANDETSGELRFIPHAFEEE